MLDRAIAFVVVAGCAVDPISAPKPPRPSPTSDCSGVSALAVFRAGEVWSQIGTYHVSVSGDFGPISNLEPYVATLGGQSLRNVGHNPTTLNGLVEATPAVGDELCVGTPGELCCTGLRVVAQMLVAN